MERVKEYRKRAAELRSSAEHIAQEEAKRKLLDAATDYEKWADRIEMGETAKAS